MKFRKSPITIICYVIAALFMAYFIAIASATLSELRMYYGQIGFGVSLVYILQSGSEALTTAIMTFMAGSIFDAIRRLDPRNYYESNENEDEAMLAAAAAAAEAEALEAQKLGEAELSEAAGAAVEEAADEVVNIAEAAAEAVETAEETVGEAAESVTE